MYLYSLLVMKEQRIQGLLPLCNLACICKYGIRPLVKHILSGGSKRSYDATSRWSGSVSQA